MSMGEDSRTQQEREYHESVDSQRVRVFASCVAVPTVRSKRNGGVLARGVPRYLSLVEYTCSTFLFTRGESKCAIHSHVCETFPG